MDGLDSRGLVLHEQIGEGKFGVVYRAHQSSVGRDVAIKIIQPKYGNDPKFFQRIELEAQLNARLEHPHIVPFHDYWQEADGQTYLVMRLLHSNVRQSLTAGPWTLEAISRFMDQMAGALSVAHTHHVVHRDIKPGNILLDHDDNAYLADFGIAKALGSTNHITTTDNFIGTPAYSAPEQIKGDPVSSQTDLYSLGIVLYELLTGKHPFAGVPGNMLFYQLHRALPSIQDAGLNLPPALDAVIQRATSKNPGERYPDARTMAHAFQQACFGLAPLPGHPTNRDANRPIPRSGDTSQPAPTYDTFLLPSQAYAEVYDTAAAIPHQPRRLIGRNELTAQIHKLLDMREQVNGDRVHYERVLLQGFGGIGKTALAATIAAEVASAKQRPVLWIEAGNANAETLFEAIGEAFGKQHELAAKKRSALRKEISALLENISLVVVDDVWNEAALRELLETIPLTLPVLVTSRSRIGLDGVIAPVDELAPDQAIELLGYHARHAYGDDPDALDLCDLLGYHPLALQIAGNTLKVEQDNLTPGLLMANIADAPHDLEAPGSYADPERKAVKDLLDNSIHVLNSTDQEVFMAMGGLFAPFASVALLAQITDRDPRAVTQSIQDLEQRGVVSRLVSQKEATPAYYDIHDLAFSYARALFAKKGGGYQSSIQIIRDYVIAHKDDYDALGFDLPNALGAARTAYRIGASDTLVDIMDTLAVDGYMNAKGHTLPFLARLDEAIAAARRMGDAQKQALHYLLGKRGNAYHERGDLEDALRVYAEALDTARALGWDDREVILLCVMSGVRVDQSEYEAAEADLVLAYQRASGMQDDHLLARVLQHRGYVAQAQEDYATARQHYADVLKIARRLGSPVRLFWAYLNLGSAEGDLGQFEAAEVNLQQALRIAHNESNPFWTAHACLAMGEIYHVASRREDAQSHLDRALALFGQSGATSLANKVETLMRKENYSIQKE